MTIHGRSFSDSETFTDNQGVDNSRINDANHELEPNPFENESSSESPTSPQLTVPFYFILAEDAPPFYAQGDRITAQFTPKNFRRSKMSVLSEGGGFSSLNPIVQWIKGGVDTLSMEVRLFSMHREDATAEVKYTILKDLAEPNDDLGRPPILLFYWGNIIPDGFPCIIEGYGDEQFDDIRPDDGSMRGVTLQLSLKRHASFYLTQEESEPIERTPTVVAKDGDTYEMIAYRQYGDPMYGVLLRRMNTRKPFDKFAPRRIADLEVGDRIKIFPKRDMQTSRRIEPECHVLKPTNIALHVRNIMFEDRKKIGYLPR